VTHLSQVVAIEKSTKNTVYSELTKAYHNLQKPDLITGLQRTYQPHEDAGERFPDESKVVQLRVEDVLRDVSRRLAKLFDVTGTRDYTNMVANADVVVNGVVLVANAPVTYLLFLEKQLKDLRALVLKLPTLDPTKVWAYDPDQRIHVASPVVTSRSKKVIKTLVKYEATDRHPAQTEVYQEDVAVGNWTAIHQSGAMSVARRDDLLARLETLTEAVKFARESANRTDVVDVRGMGDRVLNYVLNG
jgi:hypothetical protein